MCVHKGDSMHHLHVNAWGVSLQSDDSWSVWPCKNPSRWKDPFDPFHIVSLSAKLLGCYSGIWEPQTKSIQSPCCGFSYADVLGPFLALLPSISAKLSEENISDGFPTHWRLWIKCLLICHNDNADKGTMKCHEVDRRINMLVFHYRCRGRHWCQITTCPVVYLPCVAYTSLKSLKLRNKMNVLFRFE